MIRSIVKFCVYIFCLLIFRVKTVGKENIQKNGPYILCANHTSNWDPLLLISSIKRKVYIMAKEELFKNKFIKWLGKKCCVFPVKRGKKDIESIKFSLKVLKEEQILGIFPEGTRNGMRRNGKAQNGAAYLAIRTGVPVIPVAIQGTFKPFTKVKINIGKPITFEEYISKNPEKIVLDQVTKSIMDSIIELTNQKI